MHIVIKSLALNSYDMDPGENNDLPGARPSSFPSWPGARRGSWGRGNDQMVSTLDITS